MPTTFAEADSARRTKMLHPPHPAGMGAMLSHMDYKIRADRFFIRLRYLFPCGQWFRKTKQSLVKQASWWLICLTLLRDAIIAQQKLVELWSK